MWTALIDFLILGQFFLPWNKAHLVLVYEYFYVLLNSIVYVFPPSSSLRRLQPLIPRAIFRPPSQIL
jgi:hypothetical protein